MTFPSGLPDLSQISLEPTEAELDVYRHALQVIEDMKPAIRKARQAGFEVDESERAIQEYEAKLKQILKVYG